MKKKYFVILIATSTFLFTGCADELLANEPKQVSTDCRNAAEPVEPSITIDKTINSPKRVKIGEVMPDAHNSEHWLIYLLPSTVQFESRNPHQFRCKVRIITAEDDALNAIELEPRMTTYEFFESGGDVWYRSVNQFGWQQESKVQDSVFAKKIYSYVAKNM